MACEIGEEVGIIKTDRGRRGSWSGNRPLRSGHCLTGAGVPEEQCGGAGSVRAGKTATAAVNKTECSLLE